MTFYPKTINARENKINVISRCAIAPTFHTHFKTMSPMREITVTVSRAN